MTKKKISKSLGIIAFNESTLGEKNHFYGSKFNKVYNSVLILCCVDHCDC